MTVGFGDVSRVMGTLWETLGIPHGKEPVGRSGGCGAVSMRPHPWTRAQGQAAAVSPDCGLPSACCSASLLTRATWALARSVLTAPVAAQQALWSFCFV